MIVDKFVPPRVHKNILGLDYLYEIRHDFLYASRGRWALYHCLKAYGIENENILLPAYACETILEPIKLLNLSPVFYDIDLEDLNPSICSIEDIISKVNVKAALVVSLYGNPANIKNIERLLKYNNILLIDDAAQAFGSKLDGKFIGTFGDAGFFSFSPGKTTVAHLGAFFWTNSDYRIEYHSNILVHYLLYIEYYFNRYMTYKYHKYLIFSSLRAIRVLLKFIDIKYDKIEEFEKKELGGVLFALFNSSFSYRKKWHDKIIPLFHQTKNYRILKNIRGESHPHKLVVIGKDKVFSQKLIEYLMHSSIYCQFGYTPLTQDLSMLKNLKLVDGCILEIPIDENISRMQYLLKTLESFMEKNHEYP